MNTDGPSLRLWPGVVLAAILVTARYLVPAVVPDALLYGLMIGAGAAIGILLWWLLFSRARWAERLGALVVMVGATFLLYQIAHISIRTGTMGFMVPALMIFMLPPVLVLWAVIARGRTSRVRWATLAMMMAATASFFGLLRTEGVRGGESDLKWRWTPTAEDRLLAQSTLLPPPPAAPPGAPVLAPSAATTASPSASTPAVPAVTPGATAAPANDPAKNAASAAPVDTPVWPGFRGPRRDGITRAGVEISTDWTTAPPREIWRRAIGPGWSSFAVQGDLLYTQEQRGEEELVSCHRVSTGEPVWQHRDKTRFWESNGGAGPRGTPTLAGGRVYTLGATGILNVLDARTGAKIWSRHAASDTGAPLPIWGFTSSPLVLDDKVVVATSGRVIAYDVATGDPRWKAPPRGGSYSSPHFTTIAGVPQVVLLTSAGATGFNPSTGEPLWDHAWAESTPIVQPAMTPDGDILVNTIVPTGGVGIRRLHVARDGAAWRVEERWTSTGLKPYFSDFVLHKGYAYGFDGSILSAIDLADGKRKWKGGRYGEGQMLLLPNQDLLLVISEEGELALVKAAPDGYSEVAKIEALHAKTWNHPVLVGDVLLVRNGEEMAAYRMK